MYNDSMRDTKHLESFARQRVEKEKEKTLFKNKIKAVHKGANGTFEYTIKEGVNTVSYTHLTLPTKA